MKTAATPNQTRRRSRESGHGRLSLLRVDRGGRHCHQCSPTSSHPNLMKQFSRALPLIVAMLLHCPASAGVESAEESPLPAAALKLRKSYLATIETIEAPLRDRYVTDLTELYDQAVKAGKVNEALALKTELNSTMVQPMLGKWNDTVGKGVMDLHRDGAVSNTNGEKGRWRLEGEVLCIQWNNGWRIKCPLTKPGKKLRGQLTDPSGNIQPFAEKRPDDE